MAIVRDNSKVEEQKVDFVITTPRYSLEDIILEDNVRDALLDVVSAVNNENKIFNTWGMGELVKKSKSISINIYGESGTGKSMAAEVIAHEVKKKMLKVNYADIESKYVGETSKNLYKIFDYAMKNGLVLVFDEADALLSKRVVNMNNSTDVSVNQTRSVLLNILDEYAGIVVFTTNFMSNYDKAFIRRIMFHLKMNMPNESARLLLWKRYLGIKLPYSFDVEEIAKKYDGMTGADIINAIMNSAYYMARVNCEELTIDIIEKNIVKIKNAKIENKMFILNE